MSRVWRSLVGDESGFSLTEGIMALTVLAIGIVMTIAPVMAGLDILADSKLNQVGSNLGQAEIERIRSLDYADVGFPGSTPAGVLAPTETLTIQGIDFNVVTTVEYVGSVSGLNIVTGGGDGVEGAYDTGIDYKHITVIISHPRMKDIRYDTLVAPPNLAAHEGFSNIVVAFTRVEDVGTPTDETTDPYPYSCIRLQDSLITTYSTTNDDAQTYFGIDPNATDPTDPDYYYDVRIGGSCDVEDAFTGWRIHPDSMAAAEVHVGPTATATASIGVYYPATLEVVALDELGGQLTEAELTVTQGTYSDVYDEASPEWDATTATFTITQFDGYPVVPGTFDIDLDADGYIAAGYDGVDVPSGYPTVMTETVTFMLLGQGTTTSTSSTTTTTTASTTTTTTGSSTTTTTTASTTTTTSGATETVSWSFYVEDWLDWAINGADITFTGGSAGTISAVTDQYGTATVDLVKDDVMTLTVDSGYGHEVYSAVVTASSDNSLTVELNKPSTHGALKYKDGDGLPLIYMGYGPRNTDILDLEPVLLNWEGQATVAVLADGTIWDNSAFCDEDTINFNRRRRIDNPGQIKTIDIDYWWDSAGC